MKTARILGFLVGLLPTFAVAQQFPVVNDHCVIGRIGTGTGSGPSQCVPFSSFLPTIVGSQAKNLVFAGPSSGSNAQAAFRALVGADLPVPGASSLGGVEALTCAAHQWLNTISIAGVPACAQPAFSDISGTVAASQLPTPTASTLGGIESITSLAHNWIAYIDTSGVPHQSQPACGDLSDATDCNAAAGQLPATATNDFASAGKVGEEIESVVASGSAVSLSTTVPKDVTTISLTAGDWDVTGSVDFLFSASTSTTQMAASISGSANTLDTTPGKFSQSFMAAVVPGANTFTMPLTPYRLSLSTTTTIHLVSQLTFTVSTAAVYGIIRARRMR